MREHWQEHDYEHPAGVLRGCFWCAVFFFVPLALLWLVTS